MEKKITVIPTPMMMRASTAVLSSRRLSLLLEVLGVPTGRRSALAGVLRTESLGPVRAVGRGRHLEETDLADLHPRVQRDRQIRDVGQLQRDVPVPTGVHEPGRRVDDESQAAERALAVQSANNVVGDRDAF